MKSSAKMNPNTQAAIEDGLIYQTLSRRGIMAMPEDLLNVAEVARGVAKSAKCRISEGADTTNALVSKDKLNRLKRELRKLAPGCLGKE
jgi:hypothetical protein